MFQLAVALHLQPQGTRHTGMLQQQQDQGAHYADTADTVVCPAQLSDAGPGLQAGTPPKVGGSRGGGLSSSNTLLAEAARHLREQKAREADAARRSEQLRAAENGLDKAPGAAQSQTCVLIMFSD